MFSITNDCSSGYKTIKGKRNHLNSLVNQGQSAIEEVNLDVEKYLKDADIRKKIKDKIKIESEKNSDFIRLLNHETSLNPSFDEYFSFFEKYEKGEVIKKSMYRIEIHGKSYPIKGSLKSQGFQWDGIYWYKVTSDENFEPVIEENAKVKVVKINLNN